MSNLNTISIEDLSEISERSKTKLLDIGLLTLGDLSEIEFYTLYDVIGFGAAKELLKVFMKAGGTAKFSGPEWTEVEWLHFIERIVDDKLASWKEIALAVCGGLNPPQVGTAIASNSSFQEKFPPRETMRNVMAWFYEQDGKCSECGTRLSLEADHIVSKQEFLEAGKAVGDADTLGNLQLLCKRCNVIKRPSHDLGGVSFAPAQSVLIWVLLTHKPSTRDEFYLLCRQHGLTMANIRFDEAWAFAEWLKREGRY